MIPVCIRSRRCGQSATTHDARKLSARTHARRVAAWFCGQCGQSKTNCPHCPQTWGRGHLWAMWAIKTLPTKVAKRLQLFLTDYILYAYTVHIIFILLNKNHYPHYPQRTNPSIFLVTCAWAICLDSIAHRMTHIAHTLPLSAEWSCSAICKKMLYTLAALWSTVLVDSLNRGTRHATTNQNVSE
jgi:hypothetical protein